MTNLGLGFQLMGFGLLGVFTVLILFYVMIKVLMKFYQK
jgi:hypothetical protein